MLERCNYSIHGKSVGFARCALFGLANVSRQKKNGMSTHSTGKCRKSYTSISYQHALPYRVSTFLVVDSSLPSNLPSYEHFIDYTPGPPLRLESYLAILFAE